MRPFLILPLLLSFCIHVSAQETPAKEKKQVPVVSFDRQTMFFTLGLGFPNLYRMGYDEPAGYTHLKTTGFGPLYTRFEFGILDHVGLAASFGYSSFHYSYYGYSPQVIHYDDVNTVSVSLSGNYHFNKWIENPRLDLYAGAGLAVDYKKYRYGNIPPYRSPETEADVHPLIRAGARYYLDAVFGFYAEAGYDGLSVGQLGFSVRL